MKLTHRQRKSRPRARGFTLIELMVAVVVAAILVSIAIPSYTQYVRKSRRTEAKTAVLDMASLEERFFSTQNFYSSATIDLGYTGFFPVTVGNSYYNVGVVVVPAAPPLPAIYTLTATAINDQFNDLPCRKFTVDSRGVQSAQDSSGADNTATCWR